MQADGAGVGLMSQVWRQTPRVDRRPGRWHQQRLSRSVLGKTCGLGSHSRAAFRRTAKGNVVPPMAPLRDSMKRSPLFVLFACLRLFLGLACSRGSLNDLGFAEFYLGIGTSRFYLQYFVVKSRCRRHGIKSHYEADTVLFFKFETSSNSGPGSIAIS